MKTLYSFAAIAIACIASPAMASLINGDFEASIGTIAPEGVASNTADPSDWTVVQPSEWGMFQFNPEEGVGGYADTNDADAPNFGVAANMDGVTVVSMSSGAQLAQVTGDAFVSGKKYTLTVAIGFKAVTTTNFSIKITNGSGSQLAITTGPIVGVSPDATFSLYAVTYNASGAAGETGNVGVEITAWGGGLGIAIDNATLTTVPEPSSFALAGLSLVGLVGSVRRRRNRA